METLPVNNIVLDYTVNDVQMGSDFDLLKKDLAVIHNADHNIIFGEGGNLVMSCFFAKKFTSCVGMEHPLFEVCPHGVFCKNWTSMANELTKLSMVSRDLLSQDMLSVQNNIVLPVSIGEGLDKLTILEIKHQAITNEEKKQEVKREIDAILPILEPYTNKASFYYKCLRDSNQKIWDLCDPLRDQTCDPLKYNQLCVGIIKENDRRFRIKNKINSMLNSNLKEQKSYAKTKAIIFTCPGVGDMITMNGAIRYYATYFDEVTIFSTNQSYKTVKPMFADDPSIVIDHVADDHEARRKLHEYYLRNQDYTKFLTGYYIQHRGWTRHFYHDFYDEIKVPRQIRFDYFYLNRDLDCEKNLYDQTVGKLNGQPYVFIHDNLESERAKKILSDLLISDEICVYHPNRNVYENNPSHKYYSIWNGMKDNIINYATIIENASEIYIVDSSFFCLANYLQLKATRRVVYASTWYDISEYFRPGEKNKWEIIS